MLAEMAASTGGHFYFGLDGFLKQVEIEIAGHPGLPVYEQQWQGQFAALHSGGDFSQRASLNSVQACVFKPHSAAEELAQDADS
jgi:hypothetical protein